MTAPATTPETTAPVAPADFEPLILGFTCNWCSYRAADLAGTARTKYPVSYTHLTLPTTGIRCRCRGGA